MGGNTRPFDLRVNGVSYFSMCKIYELGTGRMRAVASGGNYDPVRADELAASPEERRQIAAAKAASLRELGHQPQQRGNAPPPAAPIQRDEPNLIDFDVDPTPPAQHPVQPSVSGITLDSSFQQNQQPSYGSNIPQQQQQYGYGQPPQQQQQYGYGQAPQQEQQYAPAPAAPTQQPYRNYALPTLQEASSYGAPTYSSGNTTSAVQQPPASYPPQQQQQWNTAPQPQWGAPPPAPNMMYGGGVPTPYDNVPQQQQQPPPFASPQSQATYGSAPSFAQPPRPQQQQQQQQQGQSYPSGNPW
jgi:hypothetical protein